MSERSSNYRGTIVWVVVGLVLAYLLSSGPAVWLTSQGYVDGESVDLVYAPIVWGVEHSESIESVVEIWVNLWDGE